MSRFIVEYPDGTHLHDCKTFREAKWQAGLSGQVWVYYTDKHGTPARQKIYPKDPEPMSWTDINDALCIAAKIKKQPQKPMFRYKVFCGDYSLAGYTEEVTYAGTNRSKALEAYRNAKEWLGLARIDVVVLGRKEQCHRQPEEKDWLGEILRDAE